MNQDEQLRADLETAIPILRAFHATTRDYEIKAALSKVRKHFEEALRYGWSSQVPELYANAKNDPR